MSHPQAILRPHRNHCHTEAAWQKEIISSKLEQYYVLFAIFVQDIGSYC